MPRSLEQLHIWLSLQVESLSASGTLPSAALQIALIALLYIAAVIIAGRIEPTLEKRARRIRNNRGLLRLTIAFLRRLHWLVLVVMLFAAILACRAAGLPSPRLVSLALALAATWFAAAVLSQVIRNRLLAKTIPIIVWVVAAVYLLGINDDAALLLDEIALPIGSGRLSMLTLVKVFVLLALAIWIATAIGNFLDKRVRTTNDLTPAMRVLFGKVAKIGLVVLAVVVALSAAGVDLTTLTVFSGAIGVGLGFGLQKVVSNFFSGVIILLDKSIKPGDTITVGETFGWIRELRARFVSVVTRDGREYLIPNEDFITQRVVNWSFTDDLVRLDITFGVSYDSDPHKVTQIAIEAASSVPRVESDRRPVCWITGFGDSSVDFILRFWIHDPQKGLTNVRGKVYLALWDAFKANDIDIPYPVRNVVVRDAPVGSRIFENGGGNELPPD